MDVAILHYHLNRGGVTRVIENHVRALDRLPTPPDRIMIVYGGRDADWNETLASDVAVPVERVVLPELEYDDHRKASQQTASRQRAAPTLRDALSQLLRSRGCSTTNTVIHVHNHGLGKNAELPSAVIDLAQDGWRFLLQIHDFAEDLRPTNYRAIVGEQGRGEAAKLYPLADQIHFSVLNSADRLRLQSANLPEARLHSLPNAVSATGDDGEVDLEAVRCVLQEQFGVPRSHRYVLYPVRGIRRKNIGELLLWAALSAETTFAVTLEPLNPAERSSFDNWSRIGRELKLPVAFGVGKSLGLAENLAAADTVITTSVAEGFGLVFLEASLAERPLVGRDLPGVTDDFRAAGLHFPTLAAEMLVPSAWLDVHSLKQQSLSRLYELAEAYDVPPQAEYWNRELERILGGDAIDFGRLDSQQQAAVVRRVASESQAQRVMRELNPVVASLQEPLEQTDRLDATIKANNEAIRRSYSMHCIGEKLAEIYRQVLAAELSDVTTEMQIAESVLHGFLHPQQLFPIRLETPSG